MSDAFLSALGPDVDPVDAALEFLRVGTVTWEWWQTLTNTARDAFVVASMRLDDERAQGLAGAVLGAIAGDMEEAAIGGMMDRAEALL